MPVRRDPLRPYVRADAYQHLLVPHVRKHRATTSRPLPVFRAPTSCGPEGTPAPSTHRQPSHATSAVSVAHRSRIGALRSIGSPSP
jgi:hypothetical protein